MIDRTYPTSTQSEFEKPLHSDVFIFCAKTKDVFTFFAGCKRSLEIKEANKWFLGIGMLVQSLDPREAFRPGGEEQGQYQHQYHQRSLQEQE
jgi:hypothetical protein